MFVATTTTMMMVVAAVVHDKYLSSSTDYRHPLFDFDKNVDVDCSKTNSYRYKLIDWTYSNSFDDKQKEEQ